MPCARSSTRTVERFGRLDIVVNNAATALREDIGSFTPDAYAKSMDVNLRGPVFLVEASIPHLEQSPSASIVNVISAGAFLFSAFTATYAAAKAALYSFTRAMGGGARAAGHPRQRARSRQRRHRHDAGEHRRGAGADGPGVAATPERHTRTR